MLAQNISILVWADRINGYSPSSPYTMFEHVVLFTNNIYLQTLRWSFSRISVPLLAQISLPYKSTGFTSVSNRCIIISTGNCNCLPLRSSANIALVPLSYNSFFALVNLPLKLKIRPKYLYWSVTSNFVSPN